MGVDLWLPEGKLWVMDFKTYYLGLAPDKRDEFAIAASTSRGYCNQIAYAGKKIELGMADVFVAQSSGLMTLDELPLTERAEQQRVARSWKEPTRKHPPALAKTSGRIKPNRH